MLSVYKRVDGLKAIPAVGRLVSRVLPFRFWIIFTVHAVLVSLSYVLTFLLLNDALLGLETGQLLKRTIWPVLFFRMAVFGYYDLYVGLWRYVSFQDLLNIIRATLISTACFITLGFIWKGMKVPETVYILDWVLCIMMVGAFGFWCGTFGKNSCRGGTRKTCATSWWWDLWVKCTSW